MSTSLAEQLRRLRAPQTSILVDSKKRPSILFDAKEAANKDRQTIFELGHSGLMELVSLNSSFLQFEQTLFDTTTVNLERSVESVSVNKLLDKNIKKFFYYLSPFFMIQPAHLCLEWLIRRYHIHLFNKEQFLALILPYHETKIFVKCIQLLDLSDPTDPWRWLQPIQHPGLPLSKSALLNRAANDPAFLEFVCSNTTKAIKELDTKAPTLQTQISFYCTTVIGAIEHAGEVSESNVSKILASLLKGMSSNAIDFTAAAFMITAQLVSKTKLNPKLLHELIARISLVTHPTMQADIILLLILIFQSQEENLKQFPEEHIVKFISNKWVTTTLAALSDQSVTITSICVPLVGSCLRIVQNKGDGWDACKKFLESLILEVHFKDNEAKDVIRSILDNYHKRKLSKPSENEIIAIDSDDDMMLDEEIHSWYSKYLQSFEKQYPTEFDFTIKETLQEQGNISDARRQALKTVLAFRLKSSYSEDDTSIYENLYHHSVNNRIEAVKYLVKNFQNLNITSNSLDLLKDSFSDRLADDNPKVVYEVLKLPSNMLVQTLNNQKATNCLIDILNKSHYHPDNWNMAVSAALKHLTNSIVFKGADINRIFLALIPFFFPDSEEDCGYVKLILSSDFSKEFKFLNIFRMSLENLNKPNEIVKEFQNAFINNKKYLPKAADVLASFEDSGDKILNKGSIFSYFLIFITGCYQPDTKPDIGMKIFNFVKQFDKNFKTVFKKNDDELISSIKRNKVPTNLVLNLLQVLVTNTNLSKVDFDIEEPSVVLIMKIFDILATNAFTTTLKGEKLAYTNSLKQFLETLYPTSELKLQFLSNFFVAHAIPKGNISKELQIRAIRLFNLVAQGSDQEFDVDNIIFVRVLLGLCCRLAAIRQCSLESLKILCKCKGLNAKLKVVALKILRQHEEILMDYDEFPLILCTIIAPNRSERKNEDGKDKDCAIYCLNLFLGIVTSDTYDYYLKAEILRMISQINNTNILSTIVQAGLDVLNTIKIDDEQDISSLVSPHSDIYNLIAARFEESTIKLVGEDKKSWEFIEKSLRFYKVLTNNNGKIVSLATKIMEVFTEETYDKLPEKYKENFIKLIVEAVTFAADNSLSSAGNKLMKRINLNGKHIVNILDDMKNCSVSAGTKRRSRLLAPDANGLNSAEWKNGITLLEFLQNKKKLTNYKILIPKLFELLKRCLDFDEQSSLEYAKQLLLSCLLLCCHKFFAEPSDFKKDFPESNFRVDQVVQCIRATQNPQTHHHALLLLSHCALMIPEQVLQNIMDIFTFMGSSLVRHDDAFSFQIMTNIIESIVPTLVQANNEASDDTEKVIPVIKIFADIILDVPEHRRLPLYSKLIHTLGASNYLWMFLCVLFETHVRHDNKYRQKNMKTVFDGTLEEFPKRIEVALQLTKDFEPEIILETCIALFVYLKKLPLDKIDDDDKMEIDITDTALFSINSHSSKQLRHYKYIILQFISSLTSSPEFVNRIALLSEDDVQAMKRFYQNFIIKVLSYIPDVTKAMEKNYDSNQVKFWKVVLHHCYDILDNAISLLSPDMLLVVVSGLMQHQLPAVRKKVIELLISKLQYRTDFFADCNDDNLLKLLEPLNNIIDSILSKDKSIENSSANEIMFTQQISLIAIKLLSKIMALKHIEEYKEILIKLTKIIKKRNTISKVILASVVLAITEISANLKAHSISQLSKFMPHLIEVFQDQAQILEKQAPDTVCIAIVTGIQKIFETIPLFLGPYIVDIMTTLINIWVAALPYQDREPKTSVVINKLKAIWTKIATVIPLRVLIPNCDKAYKRLMDENQYRGIKFLMNILTESFQQASGTDIQSLQSEMTTFFLKTLEFRANLFEYEDQMEVYETEEHILHAFVSLILKLSESNFRPLYHKVYDWAIRDASCKDRAITYFLLSSKIAESLKSLFVLFAGDFIQDAAELLDKCNSLKTTELHFSDSLEKNSLLIENILKTLNCVFLHDSKSFINPHRFDILMQPIVDQLENPIVVESAPLKELLISCISQLAVVVSNDTLWKQLNYQVLLKTRSNNPEHRILAFSCCVEITRKLGEDFSSLLPETIPFVAELFEDENEKVEKSCRKGVQEMEKILGESLQKYF